MDQENTVVKALKIIDKSITKVSAIGSSKDRTRRYIITKSSEFQAQVPLKNFGEGMSRLFAIIVSLVNAKDGILLVDEIENGLHYSVLPDVWKVIFKVAAQLNVQVFATTHSWETIEAFQKAAAEQKASPESEESALLIRLSRLEGDVIPTFFPKDRLESVTRNRIEVR